MTPKHVLQHNYVTPVRTYDICRSARRLSYCRVAYDDIDHTDRNAKILALRCHGVCGAGDTRHSSRRRDVALHHIPCLCTVDRQVMSASSACNTECAQHPCRTRVIRARRGIADTHTIGCNMATECSTLFGSARIPVHWRSRRYTRLQEAMAEETRRATHVAVTVLLVTVRL